MPFLDTLTSGYVLKMPQDFHVRHNVDNKNEKGENIKDSFQTFGLHDIAQILSAKNINLNSGQDVHSIGQVTKILVEFPHFLELGYFPYFQR